jgi:hypothetical protein
MTYKEIVRDIKNHIVSCAGAYWRWYVGISQDARSRLFSGHGVDRDRDAWIYRCASSSQVARNVEDYFVNECGTDGGSGGGDATTDMVYAYKKSSRTTP